MHVVEGFLSGADDRPAGAREALQRSVTGLAISTGGAASERPSSAASSGVPTASAAGSACPSPAEAASGGFPGMGPVLSAAPDAAADTDSPGAHGRVSGEGLVVPGEERSTHVLGQRHDRSPDGEQRDSAAGDAVGAVVQHETDCAMTAWPPRLHERIQVCVTRM